MNVQEVVLSHISACERDVDGAFWCSTHESLMRGPKCTVMLDALDLAEEVARAVQVPYYSTTKEYALRLNCEKNDCIAKFGWKHADDGELNPLSGWRWQETWNESKINGHACDQMTRTVYFGLWTVYE